MGSVVGTWGHVTPLVYDAIHHFLPVGNGLANLFVYLVSYTCLVHFSLTGVSEASRLSASAGRGGMLIIRDEKALLYA